MRQGELLLSTSSVSAVREEAVRKRRLANGWRNLGYVCAFGLAAPGSLVADRRVVGTDRVALMVKVVF
jgi:hypothetical protein